MSVGKNLNEMEKVVTKGAKAPESMPKGNASGVSTPGQTSGWEDLGGPTPQNYRTTDDSAKFKEPSVATVKDVVTAKAQKAEAMKKVNSVKEELLDDEEFVSDEDDEVVSESGHYEEDGEESEESKEDENEDEDEYNKKSSKKNKEAPNVEEDVNALLQGEELSEEFQEKARVIFEAAINSRVELIKEQIQEEYENALVEEIELIKEQLEERVDAYLEYVSDEWLHENALQVEAGVKNEVTESFLTSLRGIFEDHYVSIPEDKYDVIESMVDKLDEMEEKLNEQVEKNVALTKRLSESVSDVIFSDISEGLAFSQKEKFAALAGNVEFDGEENYREKLITLRESYFPTTVINTHSEVSENLSESTDLTNSDDSVSPRMESYLRTLGYYN